MVSSASAVNLKIIKRVEELALTTYCLPHKQEDPRSKSITHKIKLSKWHMLRIHVLGNREGESRACWPASLA